MDIPIQHCNSDILRRMNRRGSKEELTALITKIREKIPDVVLRTTLITGFPGETEEQFSELSEFVKEMKFDRLAALPTLRRRELRRRNSPTRWMRRSEKNAAKS